MTDGQYGRIDWCPERGLIMRYPPCYVEVLTIEDLDAEDWEPKPAPEKETFFEAEVWVSLSGNLVIVGADSEDRLARAGWRKIRVREVVE